MFIKHLPPIQIGEDKVITSVVRRYCKYLTATGPLFHNRLMHKQIVNNCSNTSYLIQQCINTRSIRCFSQRTNSSGSDDDDSKTPDDGQTAPEEYVVHQALPATVVVPEVWPNVPLIAVNRNPLFPRFIKLIDVS